jgi:fructokinase
VTPTEPRRRGGGAQPDRGAIVVGGEALVDLVAGATGELSAHLGGGPFNCARTLGRLERPVAYLGRLSSDRFGTRLRDQLRADGVSLDAVVDTDDPTTLALAELDAAGAASYRFYVDGTSAPGLTPEVALSALPARVAAVHVGTLGLVFEPTAEALEAVVMHVDASTLAMLDVNIRPPVIRDPAAYRARLGRLLPRCHAVKASDDDLAWLHPDQGPVDAARTLLEAGPSVVLLTRGAEGVTIVTRGGADDVPAAPADVVDTIGAGDAFGGGFLAWWSRNGLGPAELGGRDALLDATRFAALVAARTVERAGATPPRLAELPTGEYWSADPDEGANRA